MSVEIKTL